MRYERLTPDAIIQKGDIYFSNFRDSGRPIELTGSYIGVSILHWDTWVFRPLKKTPKGNKLI